VQLHCAHRRRQGPYPRSYCSSSASSAICPGQAAANGCFKRKSWLAFKDFNKVEKIGKLPRSLSVQGVPEGDDADINDVGYYQPSGDLMFDYGDVGY
jgi:hypothetical protein